MNSVVLSRSALEPESFSVKRGSLRPVHVVFVLFLFVGLRPDIVLCG